MANAFVTALEQAGGFTRHDFHTSWSWGWLGFFAFVLIAFAAIALGRYWAGRWGAGRTGGPRPRGGDGSGPARPPEGRDRL
jgi:hypothetical protein